MGMIIFLLYNYDLLFLIFEMYLYLYGYDWRLLWLIICLLKISLYFLFWEIVFMVFDVVYLVILYGLLSVNIYFFLLFGFSILFNIKFFIFVKWSMFWFWIFRVNFLILYVCIIWLFLLSLFVYFFR